MNEKTQDNFKIFQKLSKIIVHDNIHTLTLDKTVIDHKKQGETLNIISGMSRPCKQDNSIEISTFLINHTSQTKHVHVTYLSYTHHILKNELTISIQYDLY